MFHTCKTIHAQSNERHISKLVSLWHCCNSIARNTTSRSAPNLGQNSFSFSVKSANAPLLSIHHSEIRFWSRSIGSRIYRFIKIKPFKDYFFEIRHRATRATLWKWKRSGKIRAIGARFSFSNTQRNVSDLESFRCQKFSTMNIFVDETPVIFLPTPFSKRSPFERLSSKDAKKMWKNFWKSAKNVFFLSKFRIKRETFYSISFIKPVSFSPCTKKKKKKIYIFRKLENSWKIFKFKKLFANFWLSSNIFILSFLFYHLRTFSLNPLARGWFIFEDWKIHGKIQNFKWKRRLCGVITRDCRKKWRLAY